MKSDKSSLDKSPAKKTDGFVKSYLETAAAAREFLEEYLPAKVKEALDLSTISTEKETFVDDDLSRRLSDVIYAVKDKNGDNAYVVTIIEHQSTSHKYIALRLWKYTLLLLGALSVNLRFFR